MPILTAPDGSPIAVSGLGVITPYGDSIEAMMHAMHQGTDLPRRMVDFDPTRYVTARGLRLFNRATAMGLCAATRALEQAKYNGASDDRAQLGLVAASSFGHLETLLQYDRVIAEFGPARANPTLVPYSIPSAVGAQIALSLKAQAFSWSVCSGAASGLDATGSALSMLSNGRARACLVVGAFAFSELLALALERAGELDSAGVARPFDQSRGGTVVAEAAAAILLEPLSYALSRGVVPMGIASGHASGFAQEPAARAGRMADVLLRAFRCARLAPKDIDLVASGACGSVERDRAEAEAIASVIGTGATVIADKSHLGETFDAGGVLSLAVALQILRSGRAPAIRGLTRPEVALRYALDAPTPVSAHTAVICATSRTGSCAAVVVRSLNA